MAYAGEKKRLRFDEYDYERHSPYYPHMAPPGGPAPLTHPNLPPLSGLPSLSTPFDSPYPLAGNDFSSSRFASSGAPDTLQGSFGVQRAWPAAADEARDRALGLGPGPGAGGASMGPGLRGASDPPDAQYVMSFEAAGPSPALLLRGVHGCSERDVHAALVRFGPVFRVFMLSDWAALVEFSDIPSAQQLVRMSANQQVLVCGRPVVATYANLAQWNAMERERDAPLPFPLGSEGFPPGMGVGRGPGRAPGMGFHSGADREESEEERVQRAPNRAPIQDRTMHLPDHAGDHAHDLLAVREGAPCGAFQEAGRPAGPCRVRGPRRRLSGEGGASGGGHLQRVLHFADRVLAQCRLACRTQPARHVRL